VSLWFGAEGVSWQLVR